MSYETWKKQNTGFDAWQTDNKTLLDKPVDIYEGMDEDYVLEFANDVFDKHVEYEMPLDFVEDFFAVPERDGLVERGAKQFSNQLILSDIEKGRPSTAIAQEAFGLGAALESAAREKSPEEFNKLSTWGKIKALPKMMLAARKGYYSPEAREITDYAVTALRDYRGSVDFDIAQPETVGEKVVDIGT